MATMLLAGFQSNIVFSDSDEEYYQSMVQMLLVSLRNIHLKSEIEEHNRNLEATVKERTAALVEKTNDISNMMHNMHQGLFTITQDGIHPEYAAYLEQIFETQNIAGCDAMELLFSHSSVGADVKDQIDAAIQSLIGSDEIMFEFNSHLLIKVTEIEIPGQQKKILELDWDPIVLDGDISKIMVTVRDVTELKALEGEAAEQKQELEIIGEILSISVDKFNGFLSSSYDFIAKNKRLISENDEKVTSVVGELFRNMHTIREMPGHMV